VWPIAGAVVLLSVCLSELRRAALSPTNCMAYHEIGHCFFLACTGNSTNGFLDVIERYLARVSASGSSTHEFAAEMNDKRRKQRRGTIWHAKTLGEARGRSDGNGRKMQSENGLASLYMYTRSLYLNKARQNDGVLLAYALPNMAKGWKVEKRAINGWFCRPPFSAIQQPIHRPVHLRTKMQHWCEACRGEQPVSSSLYHSQNLMRTVFPSYFARNRD